MDSRDKFYFMRRMRLDRTHLKPEDWVHNLLEILEEVLDALHLPEEDVELEPHLHLHRDRGLGLHPEAGLVTLGVRAEAVPR